MYKMIGILDVFVCKLTELFTIHYISYEQAMCKFAEDKKMAQNISLSRFNVFTMYLEKIESIV